jgi:hypothetical protein
MIISQDPEDIAHAVKLQNKCELTNVTLRDSHASAEGTQETNAGPFSLRVTHTSTANAIVERVLRVQVRFHIECYDSAVPPGLLFNVQSAFDLDYRIEEGFEPTDESIGAFKDGNAVFNCWPYAREFVQSMTSRMGLTPPPLPLLRLIPKSKEPTAVEHSKHPVQAKS